MSERVATVISIVPFPIMEFKPGLYPGNFDIPAAKKNIPEVIHVGTSVYYVEVDVDRSIQIQCPPEDVAKALVDDYVMSNLAYNEEANCAPGVFWKSGRFDTTDIITKFSRELDEFKLRQHNWFLALVKMADDDWEKTAQHKTISDMQRYAAKSLGLERPWIIIPKTVGDNFQKCLACAALIAKEAIVCPHCRCILDKTKYDSMSFANAG